MEYPVTDFLSPALIPILGSDISAGTPGHVHLVLVTVPALRALPYQLAAVLHDFDFTVKTTALTVVALGVKLRILDIVVDVLDDGNDRGNIILHVWHFDIADGAARGEGLELRLELQLREYVNMLTSFGSLYDSNRNSVLTQSDWSCIPEHPGARFLRYSAVAEPPHFSYP